MTHRPSLSTLVPLISTLVFALSTLQLLLVSCAQAQVYNVALVYDGQDVYNSVTLAISQTNAANVLPTGVQLNLVVAVETPCQYEDTATNEVIAQELAQLILNSDVTFVIGTPCSSLSGLLSTLLAPADIPLVSYSATSPILSSPSVFPNFLRLCYNGFDEAQGITSFVVHYGWKSVTVLNTNGTFGVESAYEISEQLAGQGVAVNRQTATWQTGAHVADIKNVILSVNGTDMRIIILIGDVYDVSRALCAFAELGLFGVGYSFILAGDAIIPSIFSPVGGGCTLDPAMLTPLYSGSVGLRTAVHNPTSQLLKRFKSDYAKQFRDPDPGLWGPFAYDIVVFGAAAIAVAVNSTTSRSLSVNSTQVLAAMRSTSVEGTTGLLRIEKGWNNRASPTLDLINIVDIGQILTVGRWRPDPIGLNQYARPEFSGYSVAAPTANRFSFLLVTTIDESIDTQRARNGVLLAVDRINRINFLLGGDILLIETRPQFAARCDSPSAHEIAPVVGDVLSTNANAVAIVSCECSDNLIIWSPGINAAIVTTYASSPALNSNALFPRVQQMMTSAVQAMIAVMNNLSSRLVTLLVTQDSYGVAVKAAFKTAAAFSGIQISALVEVPTSGSYDPNTVVDSIEASPANVALVYYSADAHILPIIELMKDRGLDNGATLLFFESRLQTAFINHLALEVNPDADGGGPENQRFYDDFANANFTDPDDLPGPYAAFAYDSVWVIASAIRLVKEFAEPITKETVGSRMRQVAFGGASGHVSFTTLDNLRQPPTQFFVYNGLNATVGEVFGNGQVFLNDSLGVTLPLSCPAGTFGNLSSGLDYPECQPCPVWTWAPPNSDICVSGCKNCPLASPSPNLENVVYPATPFIGYPQATAKQEQLGLKDLPFGALYAFPAIVVALIIAAILDWYVNVHKGTCNGVCSPTSNSLSEKWRKRFEGTFYALDLLTREHYGELFKPEILISTPSSPTSSSDTTYSPPTYAPSAGTPGSSNQEPLLSSEDASPTREQRLMLQRTTVTGVVISMLVLLLISVAFGLLLREIQLHNSHIEYQTVRNTEAFQNIQPWNITVLVVGIDLSNVDEANQTVSGGINGTFHSSMDKRTSTFTSVFAPLDSGQAIATDSFALSYEFPARHAHKIFLHAAGYVDDLYAQQDEIVASPDRVLSGPDRHVCLLQMKATTISNSYEGTEFSGYVFFYVGRTTGSETTADDYWKTAGVKFSVVVSVQRYYLEKFDVHQDSVYLVATLSFFALFTVFFSAGGVVLRIIEKTSARLNNHRSGRSSGNGRTEQELGPVL